MSNTESLSMFYANRIAELEDALKRAEQDGKAAFDLSVECRARAVRAEQDAAELRQALISIVQDGIINAPCPSPLQWKLMQEKFRPMLDAAKEGK